LVDEYQDTNRPQYELMRLLAGDGHNVCAVGDEDQSIYSWRGADIRNILEFEARLSGSENRSPGRELPFDAEHSGRRVGCGREQRPAQRQESLDFAAGRGEGRILRGSGWGERGAVCGRHDQSLRAAAAGENGETARAAVLYRTNSQSRLFEEAMRRYQLKYHVVGGFSFYERAEIKDMISYLKVIQNPDDSVSLLRVINTPVRGIGKTTIEMIERLALETGLSMWGAVGRGDQAAVAAGPSARGFEELPRVD
jgi:DNA helicase-2/ATP-dependent DNA helicase PcrA